MSLGNRRNDKGVSRQIEVIAPFNVYSAVYMSKALFTRTKKPKGLVMLQLCSQDIAKPCIWMSGDDQTSLVIYMGALIMQPCWWTLFFTGTLASVMTNQSEFLAWCPQRCAVIGFHSTGLARAIGARIEERHSQRQREAPVMGTPRLKSAQSSKNFWASPTSLSPSTLTHHQHSLIVDLLLFYFC